MKTLARKTTMQQLRQQDLSQLETVCQLLNWTPEQYCRDQFEMYLKFIETAFNGYSELIAEVSHSPVFRGFWNNEWVKRNENDFIPFAQDLLREVYEVDTYGDLIAYRDFHPGDDFIVDNYLYVHHVDYLLNNEQFMNAYNHVLKLIK